MVIDTADSDFDTVLAVYTNAPTGEIQMISHDNLGTKQPSHVGFRAVKDTNTAA